MSLDQIDELNRSKSTKFAVNGSVGWGSFKLAASASGSTSETLAIKNTNNFSLKMKVAQVRLLNDWCDTAYLESGFWKFKEGTIEQQNKTVVSDGGNPPKGSLIAVPVAMLFVRGVEIRMDELHDESSELVKSFKAEGKGGWGFAALNVGGSYERNSQEKRHEAILPRRILWGR